MNNPSFTGISQLYHQAGLEKIRNANFLVVGIGGVGSWICEALVRSGAENLTIVDLDEICVSNINRQIHSLTNNLGNPKVDEMKKRLLLINPNAKIESIYDFFTEKTKDQILKEEYDYVFDGIDSLKNKCLLLSECKKRNIPVICSGGAGGKVNPLKIEVKDLNRSINDQLLFRVRKELKRNYNFPKYEKKKFKIPAVFSTELPKNHGKGETANCTNFGSVSFVTASFAFNMVAYVINEITSE